MLTLKDREIRSAKNRQMLNYIVGEITWDNPGTLQNRIMLFCKDGKCMSGKIIKVEIPGESNKVHITVHFIEPAYFSNIKIDDLFTMQEASRILANGVVRKVG